MQIIASFLTFSLPRLVGIFYASAVTLEFISSIALWVLMDILGTQILKPAQAAVLGGVGRRQSDLYLNTNVNLTRACGL